MTKSKLLSIVLFFLSFVMLASGLAFAEHECSRQVSHSDGKIDITTDCTSSYTTQNSEDFWHSLMDNVNMSMENLQAKLEELFSSQARSKQIEADMRQREQEEMEDQQAKHQDQESQAQDLRDRQETQKEQRQDLMQDMSDRK